jgi:hypothetical protein
LVVEQIAQERGHRLLSDCVPPLWINRDAACSTYSKKVSRRTGRGQWLAVTGAIQLSLRGSCVLI